MAKTIQSLTNMTVSEFNKSYNENKNGIFSYINWKINDVDQAEFLTVDVFMKAERTYNKDKAKICSFTSWLRTVANTAIIDHYRTDHSDKYQAVSDFVNSEGDETFQFISESGADTQILNSELKSKLADAFSSLKPKYRIIAKLYFKNELSYVEIAEMCNVPMGTVKGMLSRVREMLQSELKDFYTVRTHKAVNA